MLLITRRPGEKLMVGDDVVIEVIEVSGNSVRIGIAAPKSIPVYREEIYSAVKEENTAAAAVDASQLPDELPEPSRTPKTT
jgi:carbon storage regulator